MKQMLKFFRKDQRGLGTVEIVIIIAVLVGIALIFRDAIIQFVTKIIENVFGQDTVTDLDIQNIRQQNPLQTR